MRKRRYLCKVLFLSGLLIVVAPHIKNITTNILRGVYKTAYVDNEIRDFISVKRIESPDGLIHAILFADTECSNFCQNIRLVIYNSTDEYAKNSEKDLVLVGRDISTPSIKWDNDNVLNFNYESGFIENAHSLSVFRNIDKFVYIKIINR